MKASRKSTMFFVTLCFIILYSLTLLPARASASVSPLTVKGTSLSAGGLEQIQLKGISTHGLSWFPSYVNQASFQTAKSWGCNTMRLAMYTAEYNGYCTGSSENRSKLIQLIDQGVSYAQALDMYVIIDWHVLHDQNPVKYQSQAVAFFKEMAAKYKNCPNVIFEICNEPNGGTSWSTIKKYAETIISTIRSQGSNAVIIVGTPNWSQDVDIAAADPITKYSNIMYTLHFYADTHRDSLREKYKKAINAGLPIFVSEFGICSASGNGSLNTTEGNKWITLLNSYHTSYIIWNLSNKNESSSLIHSSCKKLSGWNANDLSASGKWFTGILGNKVSSPVPAVPKSGWIQTSAGYKYRLASGKYVKKCWKKINGKYYYFNSSGIRKTNWLKLGKKKYYLGTDGIRRTGFCTISGKTYYFSSKGVMKTGWQKINRRKYYFKNGVMQKGRQKIGKRWYTFNSDGILIRK